MATHPGPRYLGRHGMLALGKTSAATRQGMSSGSSWWPDSHEGFAW